MKYIKPLKRLETAEHDRNAWEESAALSVYL